MTFNDGSDIRNSRVRRRGRTTGIAAGGGGLLVVGLIVISQLLGVDLTPLAGLAGGGSTSGGAASEPGTVLAECQTGADANNDVDCRVQGTVTSLDDYWAAQAPAMGIEFRFPEAAIFDGATATGCGDATSATGPFYCPTDETIYLDTAFYDDLRSKYGANGGPLAELYVIAHEYGHHIQRISGIFDQADRSGTGPDSDSVRIEVQADCFAGAWVAAASTTDDASGTRFLEPVTRQQVADALSAASAVGDDRIQQAAGAGVNPETWTHGSSEMRQRWFTTGFDAGAAACDTFAVSGDQL